MGMRAAVVTLAGEHEQDEDGLTTAVVHLLNVGVTVDQQSGVRCAMCNERNDEHTSTCPVPLLEVWLQRE